MKKYFYCQSYQMFNLALFYKYNLKEDILIITEEDNIVKASEYLNIHYLQHRKFIFRDWEFVKKSRSVKNEIQRVISEIGDKELHFSHTQSALFCLILIYSLPKNLIFHNFEEVYPRYKFPFPCIKSNMIFFQRLFHMFLIKLIYWGIPLVLKKVNIYGSMLGLNLDYILKKASVVQYKDNEYYKTTFELFSNFKPEYPNFENLFIAQDYYINSGKEKIRYNETLEEVFTILKQRDYKLKKHPKFKVPSQISELEKLPDFLPVELFFNCVEKSVVSFHSASLITASFFKHIKAISLLDLIDISKNDMVKEWKSKMIYYSENKIHFPLTFDELEKLLI